MFQNNTCFNIIKRGENKTYHFNAHQGTMTWRGRTVELVITFQTAEAMVCGQKRSKFHQMFQKY